jgi:hypothetical protein
MAEIASAAAAGAARARARPLLPRHLHGTVKQECLANGRVLRWFWAMWVAFELVAPLFDHPRWMLGVGLAFGLVAVPGIAGSEALAGSEEFVFALPMTRSTLFCVRAFVAIGTLAALQLLGLGAIALGVPGLLWSAVVDSGFTEPSASASFAWYIYALVVPFAFASCIFTSSALSQGSRAGRGAIFLGGLIAAIAGVLAFAAERLAWGRSTGAIAGPALATLGVAALRYGHHRFTRKEVIGQAQVPASAGRWVMVAVVLLTLVVMKVIANYIAYERAKTFDDRMERLRMIREAPASPPKPVPPKPAAQPYPRTP